jgi:PAS domain S-box-containing protein
MRTLFFVTTVSFCFYFAMGFFSFVAKPERSARARSLRHSFSFLCIFMSLWALGTAFYTSASSPAEAHAWFRVFAFAGFFAPGAFLVFSLLLAGLPPRPGLLIGPFLPGLLVFFAHAVDPFTVIRSVDRVRWGWHVVYADTLWYTLTMANVALLPAAATAAIAWTALRAPTQRRRKQAGIVLLFFLPSFAASVATGIVAPRLGVETLPPLSPSFMVFLVGGLALALFRYGMLDLTPAVAADGIFKGVLDAVLLVDADGAVLHSNLSGGARSGALSAFAPDAADGLPWLVRSAGGGGSLFESVFAFAPESPVPAALSVRRVDAPDREVGGFVVIAHDLSTERKLAVESDLSARRAVALRSAETKFSRVFMMSPAGMVVLDHASRTVLAINPAALALFDLEPERTTGRSVSDLGLQVESGDFEEIMSKVARGESLSARELKLKRRDGVSVVCAFAATPLEFDGVGAALVSILDVTELDMLRRELFKAQKMETIGVMAGGIAHDFNNILTAIMGNISLARMSDDDPEEVAAALVSADAACKRARDLSKQLLVFAKGGDASPAPMGVFDVAVESVRFALSGSAVAASFSTEPDLPAVYADKAQLGQVFANLAINAVQAMPHGGSLKVRAYAVLVDDGRSLPVRIQGSIFPGRYVCVEFADTGEGIPAEHLSRIFDPYMTTKRKGTGLGLAICYSLVKRHNGAIGVESTPGAGSVFAVYLPASEAAVEASPEGKITAGKGMVLVMDDEFSIRSMTEKLLARLGYEAATAADGEEAIDVFKGVRARGRSFAAVLLDLTVIGGMGGIDAASVVRSLDPNVPIFLTTGYEEGPALQDYAAYGFDGVIHKPYSPEELSAFLGGKR